MDTVNTADYPETGDGYNSLTKVGNKNYKNYKQYEGSYKNQKYFGGEISDSGCGPTSVAIVASGLGIDKTPGDIASIIKEKYGDISSSNTLKEALTDIGITAEAKPNNSTDTTVKDIKNNLESGKPVIISVINPGDNKYSSDNHFMAILDIKGNTITISNPGRNDNGGTVTDDINNFVKTYMPGCNYILIKDVKIDSATNKKEVSTSSNKLVLVGDSRTVGMYNSVEGASNGSEVNTKGKSGNYWIGRVSEGLNWLKNTGIPSADANITSGSAVVIMLGVNDLGNSDGYISTINKYANELESKGAYAYFVSVNPIEESKSSYAVTNSQIKEFNRKMKSGLNSKVIYIDIYEDTYNKLKSGEYGTLDGLHYDSSTYKKMYNVIISRITGKSSNVKEEFESKVETCDISNGGYNAIYTSGTTGRQFKEFKQNSDNFSYPSIPGSFWGQECGLVSAGIIGSAYNNITFEDMAKYSSISRALSDFCGQTVSEENKGSVDNFANALSNGAVAVIHYPGYSTLGHYLAVLDISSDKSQVYVSNPDIYDTPDTGKIYEGWNPINRVHDAIDEIFYITDDGSKVDYTGTGTSSSVNMSANIKKKDTDGYKIDIDLDKEIEKMLAYIKSQNFDIGRYMKDSKYKEHLKNYIKAAIVTQYPDLRTAKEIAEDDKIPDNEVQGCIRVKRYADGETKSFSQGVLSGIKDSEDDGRYLSYMPYKEFTELVENGEKTALNYFSLDSSNNMVIAGWETMDVEITQPVQTNVDEAGEAPSTYNEKIEPHNVNYQKLVTKSIDYVSQVSNYQMPFSLLWTLTVYGNDETFVDDLAKLVINTDIVIGIYDATNVKIYTHDISYSKTETVESSVNTLDTDDQTPHASESTNLTKVEVTYKFVAKEIDTLKTDTPTLKIKHADMWTAIYDLDYKVVTKQDQKQDTSTKADETLETNYYFYTDGHYASGNQPSNEAVRSRLNDVIEEEVESVVNRKVEEEQQKYSYRYDVISKFIEDYWSTQGNDSYKYKAEYQLLQIKDVQTNVINMIIMGASDEEVDRVFSMDNDIMVKYAMQVNAESRGVDRDKGNPQGISEVNSIVKSWIRDNKSGSELYNKLTNNGSDTGRAKTYEELYLDISMTETKKKVDQKEIMTTDTTTATVEEVPTSDGNNVRMKVEKNGRENSFVKLLYHSKSAYSNLRIINSWFFESMEDTATIADMIDLMKYLFQKTYGMDIDLSPEDIQNVINSLNPGTTKNTSGSSTLEGQDTESIYNYLIGQGLSNAGAAGLMGNMEGESGFMTDSVESWYLYGDDYRKEYTRKVDSGEISRDEFIYNGGGYGLVQFTWWEYKRDLYDLAKEKGKSISDMELQLEFIIDTFRKRFPSLYDTLTTSNDLYTCTYAVLSEYERPAVYNTEQRYSYAQKYYK